MVVMETELVQRGRVWWDGRGTGDWHGRGSASFNHQNTVFNRDIHRQPFCPEVK